MSLQPYNSTVLSPSYDDRFFYLLLALLRLMLTNSQNVKIQVFDLPLFIFLNIFFLHVDDLNLSFTFLIIVHTSFHTKI